ncbi:DEAD/DEAH box helicase [Tautonia sociabilis]|uniref:DEAD/DEAH box helicase n=1 Tax=Tautonia sociabilis TaxID=2080755 RepID=A0A432MMT7_9BACT|nr:DEAD/DEAH box helicase [Tautonia sociabilis]RUL88507.1 DEAD/DEAH box helicase [Tautonia sociabilis]
MPRPSNRAKPDPTGDLDWALPPVRAWFSETFGTATSAQRGGWPAIASGRHTLICAPTGTGKTLAAFLACLDASWRSDGPDGTRVLYISPLKALNRDIAVNLEAPLSGIVQEADRLGTPLRPLSVGVRTGDTTAAERRAQARRPPEVMITTPESLHLLLSSRQREALRGVSHVIVDEIHDLCSSKRGASLALLLERLEELTPTGFVRIGLSATLEPLEDVSRFLGGWTRGEGGAEPRPVTIVNAGVSKRLELRVLPAFPTSNEDDRVPGALEDQLLELIRSHRSTLIFSNNRADVERLAIRLNRKAGLGGNGLPADRELVRPHHGSLSLERRRETEEAFKRGELPAVVATASLELGIDVGSVELVCLVGSPGSVSRGLQRVGRAGHSAGLPSRACLFGRSEAEVIELAALADAMRSGAVEPVRIPRNCLDVLAQQVVAIVAGGPIDAEALFRLVRRADPFRSLPADRFEAVLELLSGRSELVDVRDLRPRIRWDRISNLLEPLPGTSRLALMGGGTIPDSGQIPVYLDGGPRLGEFDEAFVLERRPGDAVLLGTSSWVIRSIDLRRVTVVPGPGRSAVVPFWRGEGLGRSSRLGERLGALRRSLADRRADPGLPGWLADRGAVDPKAIRPILGFVDRQLRATGQMPDDRSVLVETFLDQDGVRAMAVLSPFGSRFHLGVKLVLQGVLRDRLGLSAELQHGDDGILIRLPGVDSPPVDLLRRVDPSECDAILLGELRGSSLFALRFRQVSARALMAGRASMGGRTPLWFQRLRAEELLDAIGHLAEHPLLLEAARECLEDDLDLPSLRAFFQEIRDGSIQVVFDPKADSPSPIASLLAGRAMADRSAALFERRARRRGRIGEGSAPGAPPPRSRRASPGLSPSLIEPDAVHRVDSRLRGRSRAPRTPEELAELLRICGDLSESELPAQVRPMLDRLAERGVAARIFLEGAEDPERWVAVEALPLFEAAFGIGLPEANGTAIGDPGAIDRVVRMYLRTRALVGVRDVAARYGLSPTRSRSVLERIAQDGEALAIPGEGGDRWGERRNVEEVRRISIAMRRKEAVAVDPDVFADLLLRHQHAHPGARLSDREGLGAVLGRLRGFAASPEAWEAELLPRRLLDYAPGRLDELLRIEEWAWRRVDLGAESCRVAIVPRHFGGGWPPVDGPPLSASASRILDAIRTAGRVEKEDLIALSGVEEAAVGPALAELSSRGAIGGDHFDPIRQAGSARPRSSPVASTRRSGRSRAGRREQAGRPWEASGVRWSAFDDRGGDDEGSARAWALALLDRYGVVCRETAGLDPWSPPWSTLREVLDSAELRGEVRRGYFVAGLSGVQFAAQEFADLLCRHRPGAGDSAAVLLSAADPANLYGAGGAVELPSPFRLARLPSNHVAIREGRPVLLSEGFGRSLSTLPGASEADLAAAVALLPGLAGPSRRILRIRKVNGEPAWTSRLAGLLQEVGFVRDPPGLAFYAGW